MEVTSDLPTPPLPLTTPIRCLTELRSLGFSKHSSPAFGLGVARRRAGRAVVRTGFHVIGSISHDRYPFFRDVLMMDRERLLYAQ